MALLDLAGQACGLPLSDLIGGVMRRQVAPMWLIGNATLEQDVAEAKRKAQQGFSFFKLKIASRPVETDIAAALELRQALGAKTPLCADANCGLSYADACRFIDGTRAADLMFVEQPLPQDDLAALAHLARRSMTPIGADEGIHSLPDSEAHERCGAGGVSLKLIKLGGVSAALEAAQRCQRLGLRVNVAAKIAESSIASAAAIHLACAAPAVDWGVSLTHFYLAEDIVKNAPAITDGAVMLPGGPGLGVDVDEAAVERFRIKELA
jgi:muconate cycloisomerase